MLTDFFELDDPIYLKFLESFSKDSCKDALECTDCRAVVYSTECVLILDDFIMTKEMPSFVTKYCRMCAVELKAGVFIFGEEGKRLHLPEKIRKTLAILVRSHKLYSFFLD